MDCSALYSLVLVFFEISNTWRLIYLANKVIDQVLENWNATVIIILHFNNYLFDFAYTRRFLFSKICFCQWSSVR